MREKSDGERLAAIEADVENIKNDIQEIKASMRADKEELKAMLNPWPAEVVKLKEWRESNERRQTKNLVAAATVSPVLFAILQYVLKIVTKNLGG
jgi:hypothetical protein